MNTPHLEDDLLQRFFDGDLTGESATQVSEHLDACQECSRRHGSLVRLRGLINMAAEDLAEEVDFDAVYGKVVAGIERRPAAGLLTGLRGWFDELLAKRPQVWMPATAAAAVAAAVLITMSFPQGDETSSALPQHAEQRPLAPVATHASLKSEIVQVDFGQNIGTVFEITVTEGVSTPVIWINDDTEESVLQ